MSIVLAAKKRAMQVSRKKKLDHFYSMFSAGETVLDVGVSRESEKALPAQNYFLKHYRYEPDTYTGLGIHDLCGMEDLFPGKRFVQYGGGRFPFDDNQFDWAFSNAVIEHVGDDEAQLHFIKEMARVARNVFFTTPNKYFVVESHTNVLFLHWFDDLFYAWCNKYKPVVTRENLYLLSYSRLKRLMARSGVTDYSIYKNRTLGLSMTFSVVMHTAGGGS